VFCYAEAFHNCGRESQERCDLIAKLFRYGGGYSTDGWKSDIKRKTTFDLTLYFVSRKAPAKNAPGADAKAHLHHRVLFLAEQPQPESSAAEIKLTLEIAPFRGYAISLSDFLVLTLLLRQIEQLIRPE
jgi:hypothetical protein